MSSAEGLIYAFIGLGAGIFLFFMGFSWYKEKRLIKNTPTSKIRSLAMGLVEIYGEAIAPADKILKSPFSNHDCVYYRYTIQEYRRSNKRSRWVTVKRGECRDYFYLRDNTGTVLIDPKRAKIEIPMDNEYNSAMGSDPPPTVAGFIRSQGVSFEGFLGINKRMRYREYFIAPKDKVYIMGTAGDNPFVEDGSTDSNEADIMVQKGKNFYYISDKGEKDILKSYGWKVFGGLFGGAALILGCLCIIFIYFRIL